MQTSELHSFEAGFRAFDLWCDAREILDITKKHTENAIDIKVDLQEAKLCIDRALKQIEDYENENRHA